MQLKSIIVGVDGSPESATAAALAQALAGRTGGICHLVHAVSRFALPGSLAAIATGSRMPAQHERAKLERSLRTSLREVVPEETLGQLEVESGRPPVVLREAATRHGADLVVVGAKHRTVMTRPFAASIVPYLIRTLDVPLLLAGSSSLVPRRVLMAVDHSPVAPTVLRAGVEFARRVGASARAVFALEEHEAAIPEPGTVIPADTALADAERSALEHLIAEYAPEVEHSLWTGRPADAIVAEAAAWSADLIVVGSHGKGWADRLLIGSTTERLAADAPTAILVLPAAAVLATAPAAAAVGAS